MSLVFTETFAGGDLSSKWDATSGVNVQADAGARTNGYDGYSASSGTTGSLTKTVYSAEEHATFVAGMALLKNSPLGSAVDVFAFMSDTRATTHVTITMTRGTSGSVSAYRGTSAGTLLGTYTGSVMPSLGTWYYIEAKVTLHDSTGSVEVKIDGTTVLNLTGIDTKNAGTKTAFDSMKWSIGTTSGFAFACDVYLCNGAGSKNNDFLLAPKVVWLKPNGNGNSSQGVGSDGNSTDNYALVDDGPNSINGADYVDLANTGDKDTYAFEDAPGSIPTAQTVRGVVAYPYAQKTDSGARTLVNVARSGSTETDAASVALTNGTYVPSRGVFDTKPGGDPWTVSDLNSMEFGVKAAAT